MGGCVRAEQVPPLPAAAMIIRRANERLHHRLYRRRNYRGVRNVDRRLYRWTPMKSATERLDAARATKQRVADREIMYAAILSRLWPSHLAPPRKPQENMQWVVCVHSPAGQLAWRVMDEELPLFAHLARTENDGKDYTFDDKMARLLH